MNRAGGSVVDSICDEVDLTTARHCKSLLGGNCTRLSDTALCFLAPNSQAMGSYLVLLASTLTLHRELRSLP